jgi:hypothetical protein
MTRSWTGYAHESVCGTRRIFNPNVESDSYASRNIACAKYDRITTGPYLESIPKYCIFSVSTGVCAKCIADLPARHAIISA